MSSFTHSARTNANPPAAWATLQSGQTWVGIGGVQDITDVVHTGEALRSFGFSVIIAGRPHRGSARVTRSEAPHLMEIEITSRDLEGSILTRLIPDGDGTLITVTLTIRPRTMLVRLAFGAVAAAIQNGLPRQVEQFAAKLG